MRTEPLEPHFAEASEWVMPRPLQWALGLSVGLHIGALLGVPDWLPHEPENPPLLKVTLRAAPAPEAPATPARLLPPPSATPPKQPTLSRPEPKPMARVAEMPPPPRAVVASHAAKQSSHRTPPPAERPARQPARSPEPTLEAAISPTPSPTTPSPALLAAEPVGHRNTEIGAPEPAAPRAQPSAGPSPAQLEAYGDTLGKLFSREQQYPRLAAMRGWEGEVVLRISIARKGKLVAVRVLRSSGHEVLDRNAEALASALSPYPAPPDDISASELEITVPIRYRLKQAS